MSHELLGYLYVDVVARQERAEGLPQPVRSDATHAVLFQGTVDGSADAIHL